MGRNLFLAAAVWTLLAVPAFAQQQQNGSQPAQPGDAQQPPSEPHQQIADKCLEELRTEARRMEDEGYWLTGWGRRWGTGVMEPQPSGDAPATTGATGGTAAAPPRPGAAGVRDTGPWPAGPGGFGVRSPSYQIRTLYAAGTVLAYRGEEEACRAVLGELRVAYDDHIGQLQAAGVEPGEITSWRQARIAAAHPITQLQQRGIISVDDVTGMEVRNPKDERLGSVDDIIFDPESGAVSYAIVARGGFLGIGEDYIAVPWQQFAIAPGLNVLVLDVAEDELAQAPEIDPERFADPRVFTESQERTEEFWRQRREG
ncbi:MAG TPA: PRC-barrel domain-containing protein [Afifellaceae bacterium]|nr:PRC-barrel domain-containing protein [Afifellaceae bacterium]